MTTEKHANLQTGAKAEEVAARLQTLLADSRETHSSPVSREAHHRIG
jgi:hypothetical protein